MATRSSTRNDLTLAKKYEVIKEAEKNKTIGVHKLAEKFGCGKTQISTILKNKERIEELYASNASGQRCLIGKRFRESKYSELNEALHSWYLLAVSKNVFPNGVILAEKAKEIAARLGVDDFKASNGWLDRWKKKHNIKKMTISGESGDVSGDTVDSWKERVPEIVEGYQVEDVWNLDESGVFWKALPDKGFGERVKQCKGGKKSKQRFTVTFIVNGAGRSESMPIVIWKSENPRCFKGIQKSMLPVEYFSQPKAWMTGEILHKILSKINIKLRRKGRSVLLLMDNAGCHPPDLGEKYSNIKIVFLPANTTSVLQPLDLGIIKNFKVHYRKLLLRYIVARIETCSSASELLKSVDVLQAIRWVAEAWKNVSETTIKKCFRKPGILSDDFSIAKPIISVEADLFGDIDEQLLDDSNDDEVEITELISQVNGLGDSCTIAEMLTAEPEVPICAEFADSSWDEAFMSELGPQEKDMCLDRDDNDDDELYAEDIEPPPPRLKHLTEVISCLEDVRSYLEQNSHTTEATKSDELLNAVAKLQCSAGKTVQSSITDFFGTQ